MWLVAKFISAIIIIYCFTICGAINIPNTTLIEEAPLKMNLVEDIVRKVCNISLSTFSNKSPAEKAILLVRIEEKLDKSARALGKHGAKYVDLVMKGVKSKAFENKHIEESDDIDVLHVLRKGTGHAADMVSKSKGDLVHDISKKVELLARGYIENAKSDEERKIIIANMKKRFKKKADRNHALLHRNHNDMKTYVDLVYKGIDLVMKKDSYSRKRMEFAYTDNINLNKDSQDRLANLDPIIPYSPRSNELSQGPSIPKTVFLRINKTTLKPRSSCDNTIEEVCQKINMLKTLRCQSDNREFKILKLCDSVGDCSDHSDENNCSQQAIETIHTANRLIAFIDMSINGLHCFSDSMHKRMLSKQSKVLNDVLKNQLIFLEKYSLKEFETFSRRVYNTEKSKIIKDTVHEAVNVVDSLTSILDMSICVNFTQHNELDKEDLQKQILHTQKSGKENCKCNGQKCLKTCSPRCESICYDIYSLSLLTCEGVSGEDLVSLDMICDGKLDCYDELDEKDCAQDTNLAKFEATHMYDYVLKEIELKTASITFESVRSRLQSLYALVKKLRKLCLKRQPDVLEVKRVRQACFEELSKVYEISLIDMKGKNEIFNIRFFLATLNERLISALKRTSTGNDKIISSDGCVCRNNKCALPRCSKSCTRACSAEAQLTRFFCGKHSQMLNNSVPIELVCNGKVNCPNGEDENDCKKDVCRAHHLKVLRHKLQDVGKQLSGTALGEALRSWRVKVTATLLIAENKERPAPAVLYDILHEILHDLVMTYSVLESRRDNDPAFKEFTSWSRVVIDTLKSCSH